jgi:hypothetical protein
MLISWSAPLLSAPSSLSAFVLDARGRVEPLGRARAALQRTPPSVGSDGDPDALRYLVSGTDLPATLELRSVEEDGREIGVLRDVVLSELSCPPALRKNGSKCAVSAPIRAALDDIDARHPLVEERSILASLGGAIVLRTPEGATLGRVRVTAPRALRPNGVERYRAKLRFVMVRLSPEGAMPVGGDRDGVIDIAREAAWRNNALWGTCGISFGPPESVQVDIVDPPPAHMLVMGCDHGLPASGGTVRLRVNGTAITASIARGMLPSEAARRVAASIRARGFEVRVFDNPRTAASANGTTDLSVRTAAGRFAELSAEQPVSDDPTLTACIADVNLEDGLQHFGDVDSAVGTAEERALIRAFDDGDPTSIDVLMVPGFAIGGRIGESFIGADGGTIRNVVVIDRAGIRSGRGSFTMAHEIGHVLLDDPGHPDDFGVDTPTRLMDADASDPTAFGPRRISIEECQRVIVQSGPGATVPLLAPWPLAPLQ